MKKHSGPTEAYFRTCTQGLLRIMRMCNKVDSSEKSINSLLDFVSASSVVPLDYLQAFYDIPKELAPSSIYDRIKVKLKLKLARSWLSRCAWSRLEKVWRLD